MATRPTLELARLQYKRFEEHPLEYNSKIEVGPAVIELKPAGHMLGSAQVLVDWQGEKIVYTGDFKLEENLTCPKAGIHKSDILLIDTTFGRPRYKFPSFQECKEKLLEFVDKYLKMGVTPIILAYSFGKSQEAMKILSDEGFAMEAFTKAYNAASIYIRHGIDILRLSELGEKPLGDRPVIMPPNFLRTASTRGWNKYKTCFLSGWIIDRYYNSVNSNGYGIPFSDHASFDDIVRYVEVSNPKKVYTLFGPPEIAVYLNKIGFNATAATFNSGHRLSNRNAINLELL